MTFRNGLASLLCSKDFVLIDYQPFQLANLNYSHDPDALVNASAAAKSSDVPNAR